MTAEKEYLTELLSSYVNQTEPKGRAVDFGELFRLADSHDVAGIIYTQLKKLDSKFRPEGEIKSYFNQSLGYTVKNNAEREIVYGEIVKHEIQRTV